jgi:hypothetical protein
LFEGDKKRGLNLRARVIGVKTRLDVLTALTVNKSIITRYLTFTYIYELGLQQPSRH